MRPIWRWSTAAKMLSTRYAGDPTVFTNGPGRTKILITADRDWRDYLDVIVDRSPTSAEWPASMRLPCCTRVIRRRWREAIAEQLSTIPPLPNTDERAILPTKPIDGRGPSPAISRPRPWAPYRCSAPIRWWPTSATAAPRCARRCSC